MLIVFKCVLYVLVLLSLRLLLYPLEHEQKNKFTQEALESMDLNSTAGGFLLGFSLSDTGAARAPPTTNDGQGSPRRAEQSRGQTHGDQ